MSIYEKNLNLLKSTSKTLYNQVVNDKCSAGVEFIYDEISSLHFMRKQGKEVSMHSFYDRNFEVENTLSSITATTKTIIIFGLGDGELIKTIKDKYTEIEKIIVVEPSLEWFKLFLHKESLMNYVKGISVSFIVNIDARVTGDKLGQYLKESSKIIFQLSYRIVYEDYYKKMMLQAKNSIMMRTSNLGFVRNAGEALALNSIQNTKYGQYNAEGVKSIVKNKPLLIVAAGPSLGKNVHLINKIRKKAVIIAVGSAMKILDSKDIKPHFRMALDPFLAEKKIVENLKDESVPFLYSHAVFFDVLAKYAGPKIAVDISSDYWKSYLNIKNEENHEWIQSATSVAICGVDLGVKYGASKIILIGFDASFLPDKLYADGIGENRNEEIQKKLTRPGAYEARDIYGNIVLTNDGFYMNKVGLEVVTEANPNVNFINATEGGLPVNGMKIMTLEEVVENELEEEYTLNVEQLFQLQNNNQEFGSKTNNLLKNAINEITLIDLINDKRIKKLKKLKKYQETNIQKKYIETELVHMNQYEDELMQVDLYKYFIFRSLKDFFNGINDLTRYHGFDKKERASKNIEKYLKQSVELKRYCIYLENVINLELAGTLYDSLADDLGLME